MIECSILAKINGLKLIRCFAKTPFICKKILRPPNEIIIVASVIFKFMSMFVSDKYFNPCVISKIDAM